MIARQSVWTDPEVKELTAKFIPAADEVGRLQSGKDAECRLFRKIAEQGHYAGRTQPSTHAPGDLCHHGRRHVPGLLEQK